MNTKIPPTKSTDNSLTIPTVAKSPFHSSCRRRGLECNGDYNTYRRGERYTRTARPQRWWRSTGSAEIQIEPLPKSLHTVANRRDRRTMMPLLKSNKEIPVNMRSARIRCVLSAFGYFILCALLMNVSQAASAQAVPLAQHVVLVIEENTSFGDVYPSGMPWLSGEGKKYGYANNYYSDVTGSLLDYLY